MMLLTDVLIRPSLLLLAGFALAALLRRRSAASRHAVILAAIVAAAAVVPLARIVPSWTIAPITPGAASAPVVSVVTDGELPAAPGAAEPLAAGAGPAEPFAAGASWADVALIVWAAGFAVSLALLLIRLAALARTSARATRVEGPRWHQMAEEIATAYRLRRPPILLRTASPHLIATWGLLRPRVLLPAPALEWSDERVRIVLCHELAHVRRHDWLVQICAEIILTLHWFNPLMVLACRQLRRESEHAADDQVLWAGVKPPDYAAQLLALAHPVRLTGAWTSAMPMARASTLERRISAMLNARLDRRVVSPRAATAIAALFLAAALPVAALRAVQSAPLPLTGVIYDDSGAVLPGVSLTLVDWQDFKWQATTDSAGRFDFPPVQPGRYTLEASLRGFRALRNEFDLKTARDWSRAVTMPVGVLTEQITVSASRVAARPASQGPTPIRVGGNVKAPQKVLNVNPVYPESMREAGLSGQVPIEAIIGSDGAVQSARVLGAHVHPDFAAAALTAVRQWLFTPTLLNGRAVDVAINVTVTFTLTE